MDGKEDDMDSLLYGMPIIIDGMKVQRRKHRKKRINKKWAKRYGFHYYSNLKNGDTVIFNGKIYMNHWTYEQLRKIINVIAT